MPYFDQPQMAIDSQIRELAAKQMSPVAISEHLKGVLSPDQVRARLDASLNDEDWLTVKQKEQMLLIEMFKIKDTIQERLNEEYDGKAFAAIGATWVASMKLIFDRLDAAEKRNNDQMFEIHAKHAAVMVAGLQAIYEHMLEDIHERYPYIPEQELNLILEAAVPYGRDVIDGEVVEDAE